MMKKIFYTFIGIGLAIAGSVSAVMISVPSATQYGQTLIGNTNGTYTPTATSSLGLPTFASLSSYLSLSSWYATTTDGLDEGSTNLYYTNPRVLTYLDTLSKGYFFSTTSADAWVLTKSLTAASSTLLSDTNTWSATNQFAKLTFTNATGTNATTSSLAVTNVTSALHLANATGGVTAYTGASCTNQFVRSISALGASTCATVAATDVSLANLTATNATLTFSGTYTGATARTIGLNLGNANVWTALQTFNTAGLISTASSTIRLLSSTNSTSTQATSTNFFSTYVVGTNGTITNLIATNSTTTNATSTSLYSSVGIFGSIIATSSATTSMSFISSTTTKGTCLKLQDASGGTFTYLWTQSGVLYSSATSCL